MEGQYDFPEKQCASDHTNNAKSSRRELLHNVFSCSKLLIFGGILVIRGGFALDLLQKGVNESVFDLLVAVYDGVLHLFVSIYNGVADLAVCFKKRTEPKWKL